jgi:protein-S-isoprenylcysteine O-methyltransferase Ste14
MNTARYVFGVLVVTWLPPAIVWWFVVHPFVSFWRRVGGWQTVTIMIVLGIMGVAALFQVRTALLMTDYGTHPPLIVVAVLLAGASVRLALLRRKHLTTRILVGLPELDASGTSGTLLDEGIYARIRHPRYVEIVLGVVAYAVFANYLGAYVVAALTAPALHLIVLLEERELVDRFGPAYSAYSARVPRYLPKR